MDKNTVPGHLHIVEQYDGVVLVQVGGQGVIELGDRRRLVGFSRQYLKSLGSHGHGRRKGVHLLARLQGGAGSHQQLVGDDGAGAQHLGAVDSDALAVFVADSRHQRLVLLLGNVLAVVGAGIGDDVGNEQVVVADVGKVIHQRLGPVLAVPLEDVDAHGHAAQGGRYVVGGAAHEPEG